MLHALRHLSTSPISLIGGLAITAFLAPTSSALSGSDQVVIQFLTNSGVDLDATTRARWRQSSNGDLELNVALERLDPGSYELYVTDLVAPKATIVVDSLGEGEIEFASPLDGTKPLFDFPVFEEVIAVRQGATTYFQDVFNATSGTPIGGDKTKVGVYMVAVGPDFDARGTLSYAGKHSKTQFSIEVTALDAGTYDVLADGVPISQLTTTGPAKTKVSFQNTPKAGKTLLNFEPLGAQISIVQGSTVYLTAILPASNNDTGIKPPSKAGHGSKDLGKAKSDSLLVSLMNSGVQTDAKGKATLTEDSGVVEFGVVVDAVPAGAYALFVGGVERGTLSTNSQGEGQLDFSTSPSGAVLLLDFVVKGQLIELESDAGSILSVVFPNSVQAALGKFPKEKFSSKVVKVNLINAGADLDANGEVTWKLKSSGTQTVVVRARDLAEGTYTIRVNGVASASSLRIDGAPYGKGKLTYSSSPSGSQALLDFDPTDATIEVLDALDVVVLRTVVLVP
ncbi:MAG: hypothetical protein IT453_04990 [Planctomycetes bacterium]|nr:hypothetical protein [Planctomycetota bacterium]